MCDEKRRSGPQDDPPTPLPRIEQHDGPAQELERDRRAEEEASQYLPPDRQRKVRPGQQRQDHNGELPEDEVVADRTGGQGEHSKRERRPFALLPDDAPRDQYRAADEEEVCQEEPGGGRAWVRRQAKRQCEQDRGGRVRSRVWEGQGAVHAV